MFCALFAHCSGHQQWYYCSVITAKLLNSQLLLLLLFLWRHSACVHLRAVFFTSWGWGLFNHNLLNKGNACIFACSGFNHYNDLTCILQLIKTIKNIHGAWKDKVCALQIIIPNPENPTHLSQTYMYMPMWRTRVRIRHTLGLVLAWTQCTPNYYTKPTKSHLFIPDLHVHAHQPMTMWRIRVRIRPTCTLGLVLAWTQFYALQIIIPNPENPTYLSQTYMPISPYEEKESG